MNANKSLFFFQEGITYLNHGSFGACPKIIFEDYQQWQIQLETQPVQFLTDKLYEALRNSRESLAAFLGCKHDEILFFQNPTTAISNIIYNLNLNPEDEVLMTDHEYGALVRAWTAWGLRNKVKIRNAKIQLPLESKSKFFDDVLKKISSRTKVLFLSHITSPTGLVFPIKEIVDFAKQEKIITIIDGAHAPGHIDLNIHKLGCDFYTGALHKWMCGPKGTSFLYVKKEHQNWIKPVVYSWGKNGDDPESSEFLQNFQWQGTRDMSAFLTVPKIIEYFFSKIERSRSKSKKIIQGSMQQFQSILRTEPISNGNEFLGQMISYPIPKNTDKNLKMTLWQKYRIEIPVFEWNNKKFIRLSIHLYNDQKDIDSLMNALRTII